MKTLVLIFAILLITQLPPVKKPLSDVFTKIGSHFDKFLSYDAKSDVKAKKKKPAAVSKPIYVEKPPPPPPPPISSANFGDVSKELKSSKPFGSSY